MLNTNICSFAQAQKSLTDEFIRIKTLDSYMTKFDKLTFNSPIYEYLAFQNLFGDKEYISFNTFPSELRESLEVDKFRLCLKIFKESLIRDKRQDGSEYVCLWESQFKENLQEIIRECHNGEFPNDWRYEMVDSIIDSLYEHFITYNNDSDLDEYEIVDGLVDIYNYDLAKWLSDNNSRGYFEDDCFKNDNGDIHDQIRSRQYEEISFIVNMLLANLEDHLGLFEGKL
tara:strand:+ start:517 stop:1200 length:684 start_codon:yes stop_codon:yes gene_type:complete